MKTKARKAEQIFYTAEQGARWIASPYFGNMKAIIKGQPPKAYKLTKLTKAGQMENVRQDAKRIFAEHESKPRTKADLAAYVVIFRTKGHYDLEVAGYGVGKNPQLADKDDTANAVFLTKDGKAYQADQPVINLIRHTHPQATFELAEEKETETGDLHAYARDSSELVAVFSARRASLIIQNDFIKTGIEEIAEKEIY